MTNRFTSYSLIVLLFFAGQLTLAAQSVSFIRASRLPIGGMKSCGGHTGNHSVVSGDFNGDGKLDLVVGSATNLVLLLGNGDGAYKSIDLGFVAEAFLATDINGDKKTDLVVAINCQPQLLLGNGDGTFQPAKPLPAIPLAVADFNGDGKPDLLAAGQIVDGPECFNTGAFTIYPGNGDGTFRSPYPCSGKTPDGDWGTRTIVVGDLNGDGKLDVVWSNSRSSSFIYVWLGNGDGTFRPPLWIEAGTGQGAKPIAMGDINHDGRLDIVVVTHRGVSVLLGNGDGTFQTKPNQQLFLGRFDGIVRINDPYWTGSNDIFLRDFDGDGNQDILWDNAIFRGKGDGTFHPAQILWTGSADAISVICEDLNGDGKPDLIYLPDEFPAADPAVSNMIQILLNNSPNGLPNSTVGYSAATGGSLIAPSSIASMYGKSLAKLTASAFGAALPTQLGGVNLRVRDAKDTVRLAELIFVSPTQVNFIVPAETAIGPAALTIDDGSSPLQEGANVTIVLVAAPGFFTANQNGLGPPAAIAVRIRADQTQEQVQVFSCPRAGECIAFPIDVASGLPIYLSLYGTGFGLQAGKKLILGFPRCLVGGKDATVQFAGQHPLYAGLDQLNLLMPQSLPSGQVTIQCQFAGAIQSSNVISIAIK